LQPPLELTGWSHLSLQAASYLLALPAHLLAQRVPHTPLWLAVIKSLLWPQVLSGLALLLQLQVLTM